MNLRELALQEATLKALADLVKDRLVEVRSQMQSGLDAAEKESGTRQIAASLPDGTAVATLSLTDPKPEARVIDEDAFKAWVITHYPSEIERRFVTEVRAAFADKLLAEMTAAGTPRVVDRETGELHEVPGVSVKATRARNHSLRFKPAGRDAIAAAWQSGELALPGITSPAQLTAGDAVAPTPPRINLEHQQQDVHGAIWEWTGEATPHGDPIMKSPGCTPLDLLKLQAERGPLTDTGIKRTGGEQ